MDRDVMIRILGPIDVVLPLGPEPVGGRQARAVLGALAIGVGHAVSIDYLNDVLWGDELPASAENTLQSYVSHLRHLLGPNAIVGVDHSYELAASGNSIDALVFERLVNEAMAARDKPECCLRLCREALGLWRGRPFGDLADEEGFRLEAYRLDELRVVAMELGLEAELRLGNEHLAVGELESAVEEHPYRERLWYLLIAALARTERRVEALRACARLREKLAGVGLGPSEQLTEMEQAILAGREPSLPESARQRNHTPSS